MATHRPVWPLHLTWPLALVVAVVSICGLFVPGTYDADVDAWVLQARAQDAVDLFFALPILLVSAVVLRRTGSTRALIVWLGTLVSFVYAFAIFAFDVAYGPLFLAYVAGLGLSAWALAGGAAMLPVDAVHQAARDGRAVRFAGGVLAGIGVLFYLLWLSINVPAAISGDVPNDLVELGLPTNPVHVLDMSMLLPACIVAGVLAMRGHRLGAAPTAVLLVALLCITVGIESIFAFDYAEHRDAAVAGPAIGMLVSGGLIAWALIRLLALVHHAPTPREDVSLTRS